MMKKGDDDFLSLYPIMIKGQIERKKSKKKYYIMDRRKKRNILLVICNMHLCSPFSFFYYIYIS